MTAFTTRMQYHTEEHSWCNKVRKKYKCIQIESLKIKLSTPDNMTFCVGNPKEPTKEIYRTYQNTTIRDFSKAAEYKVNIKKFKFL